MSFSYFDQGGFSTIAVKDPKMKMLEIFDKVIKRRQLHKGPLTGICTHDKQFFSNTLVIYNIKTFSWREKICPEYQLILTSRWTLKTVMNFC